MNFFNFNFGHICLLCHEPIQKLLALCEDCEKTLPESTFLLRHHTVYFDRFVALFDYDFPIDKLITQLKFQYQLTHAKLFAKLMIRKLIQTYQDIPFPSLLIPVPLHPKRLRERGFNQALEIAKPISKSLNIPLAKNLCCRIKHTAAQSGLSQSARLSNLKNAFVLKKPLVHTHIALLDDVITTGETLRTLANLLRKNGAAQIDVWCCAQTRIHA